MKYKVSPSYLEYVNFSDSDLRLTSTEVSVIAAWGAATVHLLYTDTRSQSDLGHLTFEFAAHIN